MNALRKAEFNLLVWGWMMLVNPPRKARGAGGPEDGMATAEYAIATIAAVGFAGLLIVILKSDLVRGFLERIISSALSIP